MKNLNIAVAQFEPHDGNKEYNLGIIEMLTKRAIKGGADLISFHELSITAYTYLKNLDRQQIIDVSEKVPDGKSCQKLMEISSRFKIPILAGLIEKDGHELFNTYICVHGNKLVAKYRKLHPFISEYMSPGNEYVTFELFGWKCGILICYDNNVIENVRATALLGADIIFAPHVTCCTPSAMPGRGFVDDKFWQNRVDDPEALRAEFDGPKGRGWLMRWLPARAYDSAVYYIYTNPIGYDGEHLKNGNSMVLDPYGEVLSETRSFEDDIAIATITSEKLKLAGGYRYRKARRPELYRDIIGAAHQSETKPIWLNKEQKP